MKEEVFSIEFEEWFNNRFWHECYLDIKYHLYCAWMEGAKTK